MSHYNETNNPIGFSIYLFKNKEKIKITNATAKTVLIIKFFLSETAFKISLACSETNYITNILFNFILLNVLTKKLFFISFQKLLKVCLHIF